jgi:hypothetical protein
MKAAPLNGIKALIKGFHGSFGSLAFLPADVRKQCSNPPKEATVWRHFGRTSALPRQLNLLRS